MKTRKTFEEGGVPGWENEFRKDRLPDCLPRTELIADISKLLRPGEVQYSVIVGATGTGKSATRPTLGTR